MKRPLLAPLIPLYAAVTALRNTAYERHLLRPGKLRYPVVSIGNIAAGGAGKTPLVILLAQLLKRHGIAVDVLSRGYGRTSTATLQVSPFGSAQDFGDEPLLIARTANVPVYVAKQRIEAGKFAEQQLPEAKSRVHLLDDGFQHQQLARSVDIVMVNASDLEDCLLPGGDLREPFSALRRADILVLREEEERILPVLRNRGLQQPVWLVRRELAIPHVQGPVIAFCGIARPQDFFTALTAQGVGVAARVDFRDHHAYTLSDAGKLKDLGLAHHARVFLTTAKDMVKLDRELLSLLEAVAPVQAVELQTHLLDEERCVKELLQFIDF